MENWAVATGLEIISFNSSPKEIEGHSVVCDSLWPHRQNTEVGRLSLLQGFSQPRLNIGLPHCRRILYQLSYQGSPIPKKVNAKEYSNYCPTALISHSSKVMLKILQAKLQQYLNQNFQMYKLNLERQRNQRSNCQHPLDHRKSKKIPGEHLLLLYWLC